MFSFILPLILCLRISILPIALSPKAFRLYIINNKHQLFFLLDNLKSFVRVNNISLTWNRYINEVQPSLSNFIQSPITNSILHYVTYDALQRCWIEHMVLIFAILNIKIGTGGSSRTLPFCLCPKITHMLEELLLCILVIFKVLCTKPSTHDETNLSPIVL